MITNMKRSYAFLSSDSVALVVVPPALVVVPETDLSGWQSTGKDFVKTGRNNINGCYRFTIETSQRTFMG